MKKFEKKILSDLYESVDGLFVFTLYSRYKIEPDEIFLFIDKYLKKEILKYENDKLSLTDLGKNTILKNEIAISKSGGKFSNIPEIYKRGKIDINSPYLPDIKNVSEEILKIGKV